MGLNPRASVLWHYLEKSLYVLEYSGTHGPSSLDWVFMEVNYTQMSTHTQAYKCNPPICKYISPQRNGSSFLGHSNRLIKPLEKSFRCKGWPGIWSGAHEGEHWIRLTCPERGALCRRGSQRSWSLVCYWMTAPHHLLPWITLCSETETGDGTRKMIVKNKEEN